MISDFCVIISLLWGDSVILFINNKLYEFSESNLNDMYLDEGKGIEEIKEILKNG